jgi:hypothetical protein
MTTNLYIGDHVFNLESLVFGYKIYDQAYFDLNLLITLIFFSIYEAYYISNQKQKKVDIFKIFKDEVNNVFDTNIFKQVKTGNFISKKQGPDGIHVNVLRDCSDFDVPLSYIFNLSIRSGHVPQDWRDAEQSRNTLT